MEEEKRLKLLGITLSIVGAIACYHIYANTIREEKPTSSYNLEMNTRVFDDRIEIRSIEKKFEVIPKERLFKDYFSEPTPSFRKFNTDTRRYNGTTDYRS